MVLSACAVWENVSVGRAANTPRSREEYATIQEVLVDFGRNRMVDGVPAVAGEQPDRRFPPEAAPVLAQWVCHFDLAHLRYSDLAHPLETIFMTQ